MSDLPTREEWDGSLRPREWFNGKHSGALWDNAYDTLLAAYVDGTLLTRREFIDSLDVEAFVKEIGAGMDAAWPKEDN